MPLPDNIVYEETVTYGKNEIRQVFVPVIDEELYKEAEENAKNNPKILKIDRKTDKKKQMYFYLKTETKIELIDGELVSIVYCHIPPTAQAVNDLYYVYPDYDPYRHIPPTETETRAPVFGNSDSSKLFIRKLQETRGIIPDNKITETPKPRETVPRNWSAYTKGQQAEFALFRYYLKGLLDLMKTDTDHPMQKKLGRHPLPDADMLFLMIDRVHHELSIRRYYPFAETAKQEGFTTCIPSQAKLADAYDTERYTEILNDMLMISATPLSFIEHHFSVDASGFRTTRYSDWFGEKHKVKQKNIWKKMHIVVGVNTNVICAIRITDSNVADTVEFPALITDVSKLFNVEIVSADKGYFSSKNFDYAKEHDIRLYIPFKKNANPFSKNAQSWRDIYDYALEKPDEFAAIYHKRSNVETTFSAIKQKLGEIVRCKNPVGETNYLLCKAICYNLILLIMYTYKLGIVPEFMKDFDEKE